MFDSKIKREFMSVIWYFSALVIIESYPDTKKKMSSNLFPERFDFLWLRPDVSFFFFARKRNSSNKGRTGRRSGFNRNPYLFQVHSGKWGEHVSLWQPQSVFALLTVPEVLRRGWGSYRTFRLIGRRGNSILPPLPLCRIRDYNFFYTYAYCCI